MKNRREGYHRAKAMSRPIRNLIWGLAQASDDKREDVADTALLIIEKEYPKEIPPTRDTIIREVSKARNIEPKPLDIPWSLGACRDYPTDFPVDSLPLLIEYKSIKFDTIMGESKGVHYNNFSIRKAKWLVRLQPIIQDIFHFTDFFDEYSTVSNAAEGYAHAEYMSETMGEKYFDSRVLDEALCAGDIVGIFSFGSGYLKKTDSICKGDCNSCKYEPAFEGKLSHSIEGKFCQPKGRREYLEKLEKQIQEGEFPKSKYEGDK